MRALACLLSALSYARMRRDAGAALTAKAER